jgi:coenzyme Q-binding protein COQ10
MPRHRESRHMPWTAAQMFDLVADIGRYPEFLPWITAMRLRAPAALQASDSQPAKRVITADMVVGFKMVREQFTSRVTLERPGHIYVDYLDGPLKYLHNDWTFRDSPDGGSEIDFGVAFEFKSKMFERLAGMFFGDALRRMVTSFEARAAAIYAPPALGHIVPA